MIVQKKGIYQLRIAAAIICAIVSFFPIYWVIVSSLKPEERKKYKII